MTAVLDARRRDLERLAAETWQLLVVGGGITGAGIALDAASRGLRAALVEREDYAVGTSGRSSRLIHGGLRYLEQVRIGLVREALSERRRLLRLAPHLVRIEPFMFPLYGGPWTRPFYGAGLTLYDLLGASEDGGWHRHLTVDEALEATPVLRRKRLRGAFVYHDGQEDDARFTLAVARTARAQGALPVTRLTAVRAIERGGRIAGVVVRDELDGAEFDVLAERVVDATGVWSGRPDGPFPLAGSGPAVRPSRGTHIVVPRDRIPSAHGLTLRIPGRVCFLVPWPDRWVIGTTDIDDDGLPCQTRTLSVGDGIEVSQMEAGGAQSLPDEGQYAPYVVAGGELRHYPAVFAMHFALRIERVAQQATLAVVKRDASFVAGGFNTKNK